MLRHTLSAAILILSLASPLQAKMPARIYNLLEPPVACTSSNLTSCPKDAECLPNTICTLNTGTGAKISNNCHGTCAFRNMYPQCTRTSDVVDGGCADTSKCVDDPRNPDSCGAACDEPGICVPDDATRCRIDAQCKSQGKWCYQWPAEKCKIEPCWGVCL